ncbi:MAG: hypothetical protein ACLGI2_03230 [Acidimicrobiia bacterium]
MTPRLAAVPPSGARPADAGRYLLVASLPGSGNRARAHLALFSDAVEAKAAFRAIRLQTSPRAEWAHLVSIDAGGALRPVCWFGTPSPSLDGAGGAPWSGGPGVTGVKPPVRRRRTWPRRTPAVTALPTALPASLAERSLHPSSGKNAS